MRIKNDPILHNNDNNLEDTQIRQNSESSNWQKDSLKCATMNKSDIGLFQSKCTNVQSTDESTEWTDKTNERSQNNKGNNKPLLYNYEATNSNNESLCQNVHDKSNGINENTDREIIEKQGQSTIGQECNVTIDERTKKSNIIVKSARDLYENLYENKKQRNNVDSNTTIKEHSLPEATKLEHFTCKTSSEQTHDENCTSEEPTSVSSFNDDHIEKLYENHDIPEIESVQPSNLKDEDGYRTRDMFGRDSSSEDEDYEDYFEQQLGDNEFVHISEIDFSMFP